MTGLFISNLSKLYHVTSNVARKKSISNRIVLYSDNISIISIETDIEIQQYLNQQISLFTMFRIKTVLCKISNLLKSNYNVSSTKAVNDYILVDSPEAG